MQFALLGALEVTDGGRPVAIGGAKQRALLALLVIHANEVVSRDRLIDALWGGQQVENAAARLDHQVSRLRKALGTDTIVTRAGGYALAVEQEALDVHRFEALLDRGRESNAAGRPAEAQAALAEGLALWRGTALADLVGEPFAARESERLEELRLAALEERIDAELALGRDRALVPELERLVAAQPYRERPRAQLMLALYRAGRQADALAAYASGRRLLVDELGLEPGQALRQLEQEILRQDPRLEAQTPVSAGRRRRRALATAVGLVVAAGAAAAAVLLAGGGTKASRAQELAAPNSVVLVSPVTGKQVGRAEVEAPLVARFGAGALWSLSFRGIVTKIDPRTGDVLGAVNAVPLPCGLAVGAGSVWVTDCTSPTLVRIEPAHVTVVDRIRLPVPEADLEDATQGVAVGASSVWVGQGVANPSYVYRIDTRTGRVRARITIAEGGAQQLAFGDGAVWVGGGILGRLSRIDPATNGVTNPVRNLGSWLCCLAAGGGYVWAAVIPAGKLWKFSGSGQILGVTRLGPGVQDVMYAANAAWASTGEAGRIVRIDATTDRARSFRIGHNVIGLAVGNGLVAASVQPSGRDVTGGLTGRIVRVALKTDDLDATSTDPLGTQYAFNPAQLAFHYATCAKLFDYPDAAGAAGRRLVPEVAAGWPRVTDGGRTYTFRLRRGFGFSPPSRESVGPDSFRHEIERVLSPKGRSHWNLLGDVVGAAAFHDGRAAHVAGVTARGDTLVIRLVRAAGDLPRRLARPELCAVPAGLPTIAHGLPYPIPSAGPYYLADRSSSVFVLKPNPRYGGSRPQRLDAIVISTSVDVGAAAAQVAAGTLDYIIASQDPALAPDTDAAESAGPRYSLTANTWTERLALNTSRPLFADARVRQAVAAALDRATLARALDGGAFMLATASLLPPNLVAPAADVPAATPQPLGGPRRQAVLAAAASEQGEVFDPEMIATLREELAAIGIDVRVVARRQGSPAYDTVPAHADIARADGNAEDASDPVEFLRHLTYLPAAARARLSRIATLPYAEREHSAAALAAGLESDAAYVAFANRATPDLVSKRLRCVIHHPVYAGVDLAALCVRG